MLWFMIFFFGLYSTCIFGQPVRGITKTYDRDAVLKRLLKQKNEGEKISTKIESYKNSSKDKTWNDVTRFSDVAKMAKNIPRLTYQRRIHESNEKELMKIMHGGEAKKSKDLFGNKKYRAGKAHPRTMTDLEFVTQAQVET